VKSRLESQLDLDALVAVPADEGSFETVVRCVREAADYFHRAHGATPPERIAADGLANAVADDRVHLYVLTDRSGEPAGLLEVAVDTPAPGEATIALLVLAQRLRAKGLGKKVARALLAHLREAGLDQVRLGVMQGETAAMEFWSSLGFWNGGTADGVTLFELALS
jgi:ribosomal protein S18 acetylase RimI-like enzyme